MVYDKPGMFYFIPLALILLGNGCMPVQITEEPGVLHDKSVISTQSIQQKDVEIKKLKELLDDRQRQLRELNDQLNACRGKK